MFSLYRFQSELLISFDTTTYFLHRKHMLTFNSINPVVLFGVLSGLSFLILATVITVVLKNRKPENTTFPKVLLIIKGWWIIATVLSIALLTGRAGFVLLTLVVSLKGVHEFLSIKRSQFLKPSLFIILTLLTTSHYSFLFLGWKNFFLFIVPTMTFIFLPLYFLIHRTIRGLIKDLWRTQSAIMLCVYFLSFIPGLFFLNDNPTALRKIDPEAAFLFLFFVTEMNDVFQFIAGKIFGQHKIVPELSPNKTLEGFIGGAVLTLCLSLILAPLLLQVELWQSAVIGICISLSGMTGDLMFSAIKRTFEVKDFAETIPGHGGVLDRVDSLIFTAPTLYCLMYLFIH